MGNFTEAATRPAPAQNTAPAHGRYHDLRRVLDAHKHLQHRRRRVQYLRRRHRVHVHCLRMLPHGRHEQRLRQSAPLRMAQRQFSKRIQRDLRRLRLLQGTTGHV